MSDASSALSIVPKGIDLATRPPLAVMSNEQFAQVLADMKLSMARVDQAKREVMIEDIDYGTIEGTPKPTIYKPGVEKLLRLSHLAPTFDVEMVYGDNVTAPAISVRVLTNIHVESSLGPIITQGVGEANSWEKKYRYRKAGRECPTCGKSGTIFRQKKEKGEGWICIGGDKGGCWEKFVPDDPAILGQASGRTENEDPHDGANTLVKMAKKRSLSDGALTATCSSGLFTQDLEELLEAERNHEARQGSAHRDKPRVPSDGPASIRKPRAAAPVTVTDVPAEIRAILADVAGAPNFAALNVFSERMDALRVHVTAEQWAEMNAALTARGSQLRGEPLDPELSAVGGVDWMDDGPQATAPVAAATRSTAMSNVAGGDWDVDDKDALLDVARKAGKVTRAGKIWLTNSVCEALGVANDKSGFEVDWICAEPRRLRTALDSLKFIAQQKGA